MKPIVKESDYSAIKNIINNLTPAQKTKEVGQLMNELELAKKVPDNKIPKGIIQLNSYFEVEVGQPAQIIKMTMVIPKNDWVLPGGLRKLKILKVENQVKKEVAVK